MSIPAASIFFYIYKMHIAHIPTEIKPKLGKKAPQQHPNRTQWPGQWVWGIIEKQCQNKCLYECLQDKYLPQILTFEADGVASQNCKFFWNLTHCAEPILFFFDQNASSLFQLSNISVSEGCHAMNVASKKPRRLLGREPADASSQKSENINNS